MSQNRFNIHWICYYEPEKKIWGWFTNPTSDSSQSERSRRQWGLKDCYCFWAVCGKTISMNKHVMLPHNMDKLQDKKLANKYQPITEDELLTMWPSFHEDLHNRFIFASLSEKI
jgi:hypothetical protein